MKTFVVLAGLMVIVPRTDGGVTKSLEVLVLDVQAKGDLLGEAVHRHVTRVTNLGGTLHDSLTGVWSISSSSAGAIELVDPKPNRMLSLNRPYGDTPLPVVKPECYGEKSSTAAFCTHDGLNTGMPLVKARLTFTGGWRVRPVEITHDREPRARTPDDTTWGFVQVPRLGDMHLRLPAATPDELQLAGGLILEPLDDAGDVKFIGPQGLEVLKDLAPLRPRVCRLFAGYEESCAVVRFLNTMHAMQYRSGDQVQIDFTQDLVYDLLATPPAVRYLMFMRKDASPDVKDILYPGGGGSPYPRPCPPPMFAAPAEE